MHHHAFVIEAERSTGLERAREWVSKMLGINEPTHPDCVVLEYGLLSVDDARGLFERASGAPLRGEHKAVIIVADRIYHEAQNALLKLFEEPPRGTYLLLVLPTVGGLLPTLLSRVQLLESAPARSQFSPLVRDFLSGSAEKRVEIIKRLMNTADDEERKALRGEALMVCAGIESAVGESRTAIEKHRELLAEVALLRGYLHDRSAPVKLILEHLALVTPTLVLP
jgi:hypothetical protein